MSLISVKWILLRRFCQLTGYSEDAVHAKIREGVWRQGHHYRIAPDGHITFNMEEYEQWAEAQPEPERSTKHQATKTPRT